MIVAFWTSGRFPTFPNVKVISKDWRSLRPKRDIFQEKKNKPCLGASLEGKYWLLHLKAGPVSLEVITISFDITLPEGTRGIHSTSSVYKELKFYLWENFFYVIVCLFLIIVLFLAMAKSVLVFLMLSGAQEERAVLLSLVTLEAVQRNSWDIFWKKKKKIWSTAPCYWASLTAQSDLQTQPSLQMKKQREWNHL